MVEARRWPLELAQTPWKRPSVWLLVAANLVPVYGVLALGWEIFPLVLLFWIENVVVGAFNVLRLLVAQREEGDPPRLFIVPFFAFHYGIFTLVHGVFVFALFSPGGFGAAGGPFGVASGAERAASDFGLVWPVAALFGSHAFSFVANFIVGGEYRRTSLHKTMARPYGRVVVLHVAILVGAFLIHGLGSPVFGLVLLIVLKIGLDLRAHVRSHATA